MSARLPNARRAPRRLLALGALGALVLAGLAATGCHRDRSAAEAAIRSYDGAVIQAFRSGDPSRLGDVALAKEAERVRVLVDMKKADRLVLESELQALEVTGATAAGAKAMVAVANERWRYFDRPLDPGRSPGTVYVSEMVLRYHLGREGDAWKVESVDTIANRYLEPPGLTPETRARATAHGADIGHGK